MVGRPDKNHRGTKNVYPMSEWMAHSFEIQHQGCDGWVQPCAGLGCVAPPFLRQGKTALGIFAYWAPGPSGLG